MRKLLIPMVLCLIALPAIAKKGGAGKKAVVAGTNAFALDLYLTLRPKTGNVVFSPWSVAQALAMVRQGAEGKTAEEMDAVLHVHAKRAAKGFRALVAALRPRKVSSGGKTFPAYEMTTANRVWAEKGLSILPAFTDALSTYFEAPIGRVDFEKPEEARSEINSWVAKNTANRIRDIVPAGMPPPQTLMVLANAIHFKAAWADPFDKAETREEPFTTAAGKTVKCPMMRSTDWYGYADVGDATVLSLSYRGEPSMLFVLPKTKDGLPAVEKRLDVATVNRWISACKEEHVSVGIPRFDFTRDFQLSGALAAMGMKDAFDPKTADFKGISKDRQIFLGPVLHKAFISVDEAGTEAAAATVEMLLGARLVSKTYAFTADHPFLFLIRHDATGEILFMGRVDDPTAH